MATQTNVFKALFNAENLNKSQFAKAYLFYRRNSKTISEHTNR